MALNIKSSPACFLWPFLSFLVGTVSLFTLFQTEWLIFPDKKEFGLLSYCVVAQEKPRLDFPSRPLRQGWKWPTKNATLERLTADPSEVHRLCFFHGKSGRLDLRALPSNWWLLAVFAQLIGSVLFILATLTAVPFLLGFRSKPSFLFRIILVSQLFAAFFLVLGVVCWLLGWRSIRGAERGEFGWSFSLSAVAAGLAVFPALFARLAASPIPPTNSYAKIPQRIPTREYYI